jgi:hypothetical protein
LETILLTPPEEFVGCLGLDGIDFDVVKAFRRFAMCQFFHDR